MIFAFDKNGKCELPATAIFMNGCKDSHIYNRILEAFPDVPYKSKRKKAEYVASVIIKLQNAGIGFTAKKEEV